jgi:small-conductance mechanosensitive channel
MLNLNSCLKLQCTNLKSQCEAQTKSLNHRDKEVEDLHMELQTAETKLSNALHKCKMEYEDRILKLSSDLASNNSGSVGVYKIRIMQQEREIAQLKRQLSQQQAPVQPKVKQPKKATTNTIKKPTASNVSTRRNK